MIDPTVAWIFSRVGATNWRGRVFVSYCTTVFVCITRLLAVVVSQTNCAGLSLLFISDKKAKTTVLVYDK